MKITRNEQMGVLAVAILAVAVCAMFFLKPTTTGQAAPKVAQPEWAGDYWSFGNCYSDCRSGGGTVNDCAKNCFWEGFHITYGGGGSSSTGPCTCCCTLSESKKKDGTLCFNSNCALGASTPKVCDALAVSKGTFVSGCFASYDYCAAMNPIPCK